MEGIRYAPQPNMILEALSYLGARANNCTARELEKRLRSKGVTEISDFHSRVAPYEQLRRKIDQAAALPQDKLEWLFKDLEGFPFNSVGAFSPAFLLFFPKACQFEGPIDAFLKEMSSMTLDQAARDILISLNLSDDLDSETMDCSALFMDAVLSMSVCDRSRLALIELHRNYRNVIQETAACLRTVVSVMEAFLPEMLALGELFVDEVAECGLETYLSETTSQQISGDMNYQIRPLLLGPDMNLTLAASKPDGNYIIYCGVLHRFLKQQVIRNASGRDQVYDNIHLLADRTRFDILYYLHDHPAYVQELSDQFALSRNTMHHHLSKLLNAGLISCTVKGNRVYYTINRERLDRVLEQLRALLLS